MSVFYVLVTKVTHLNIPTKWSMHRLVSCVDFSCLWACICMHTLTSWDNVHATQDSKTNHLFSAKLSWIFIKFSEITNWLSRIQLNYLGALHMHRTCINVCIKRFQIMVNFGVVNYLNFSGGTFDCLCEHMAVRNMKDDSKLDLIF